MASMGLIPAGAYRNMDYVRPHLEIRDTAEECLVDLITDPQTSGGLLIALPGEEASELVRRLHEQNMVGEIIGEMIQKKEKDLIIE